MVQDITFENNYLRHTAIAFNITSEDGLQSSQLDQEIRYE